MLKKIFILIFLTLFTLSPSLIAEESKVAENNFSGQKNFLILFIEDFSQEKLFKLYLPNLKNLYNMGYSGVHTAGSAELQDFIENMLKLKNEKSFPNLAKEYGFRIYAYGFNIKKDVAMEYLPNIDNLDLKFLKNQGKNGCILALRAGQENVADKVIEKLYESGELKNTAVAVIGSGPKGLITIFANKIKKSVQVNMFLDEGIIPTLSIALGIYPPEEWGPICWSLIYTGDWETDNQNKAKEQINILKYALNLRTLVNEKEGELIKSYKENEKLLTIIKQKEQENIALMNVIKKHKLKILMYKFIIIMLIIIGLLALLLEYKILKKKYLIF